MKLRNYLAKYGVRIAVIVILCALVIGLVSSARGGRAGLLRNADGSLKAPLEKATTAALDWLEGVYGYLYEYDSLVEETAALKAENAELREQVRSYAEMETENERLRTLLGFAEKHTDFTLETAKIVSWDASNYTSAFTISKGSDSGVDVGDCVITEYGALVGQVIELGSDWATVRPHIDVEMNLGAQVGP
ncbi:MAG: rod shape-determining protein MreC [Oscillospiraceae bacterium]|nr:rod shape-determining protein MreC [Oscillospiraceae bacterium]